MATKYRNSVSFLPPNFWLFLIRDGWAARSVRSSINRFMDTFSGRRGVRTDCRRRQLRGNQVDSDKSVVPSWDRKGGRATRKYRRRHPLKGTDGVVILA